jgi:hypothetical protein
VITDATLLDALNRAAAAHGEYESTELGGVYDQAWADWYAKHMSASLHADGFAVAPGLLADELRAAATAHGLRDKTPDDPDENWPAWYVTRMMPAVRANVSTD